MAEYDAIAKAYRDSKRLPFRESIERYTLFELLGDVTGRRILDVACGDGYYTRLLKRAGAAEVAGVDASSEMIRLAKAEEDRRPLGCRYVHRDVAALEPDAPADVVVAMYLLNYARTETQLVRLCRSCHDALRPGGRFIGVNDNVRNPPRDPGAWKKYGLERSCPPGPREGDAIVYTLTNPDGRRFTFRNFYLTPDTYRAAFRSAGFEDFEWVELSLDPGERDNRFWDDFMRSPPIVAFRASRPR